MGAASANALIPPANIGATYPPHAKRESMLTIFTIDSRARHKFPARYSGNSAGLRLL
jgi:hypothetical protein